MFGIRKKITPSFNLVTYLTVTLYVMLKIAGEFALFSKKSG